MSKKKKKPALQKICLRRYEFPITLGGIGSSPDEAWEDALESFMQDPGCYDKAIKGDLVK